MSGSFIEMLKNKAAEQPKSQESTEAIATEEVEVAEMELEEEEQEIEDQEEPEISDQVRKELSEKGSFLDKLKEVQEAKEKEEAEALALEEQESEDAEQEEEEAEDVKAPVFEVEIEGKKYESLEEVQSYLSEVAKEKEALEAEKAEIQNFVDKMSDPTMLEVMKYVGQGYDFPVALIKAGLDESIFDLDSLEEPTQEQVIRAKIEKEQAQKEYQKQQAKLQKNMEESNKALMEFQSQEGFDEKVKGDLVNLMSKIHSEILDGLVTKETLAIFSKALNYEKVVEESKKKVQEAKEAGEVLGRNQKIAIERQRKLGDNMPNLKGTMSKEVPKKENRLLKMVNIPEGSFMAKLKRNT